MMWLRFPTKFRFPDSGVIGEGQGNMNIKVLGRCNKGSALAEGLAGVIIEGNDCSFKWTIGVE
jgi:hypothetical protein